MKSDALLNLFFIIGLTGSVILPQTIQAQSSAAPPSEQRPTSNEQQKKGEGLFLQRCSLCHLPVLVKKAYPSVGPRLNGLLKDGKSSKEKESLVRQFILNGGPSMPGFRYGLDAKEIDDLLVYLRTL